MQDLLDTETAMREEKDTNLETKITNNENALATLNGSGDGSVSKTVAENIDKKLDKTTDVANSGKAVVVDENGNLGFGTAGIDTDAVKSLIKENAVNADYDENSTIKVKLDQVGNKVVSLTRAEYDALETKNDDTLYIVTDDDNAEPDDLQDKVIDDSTESAATTYSSKKITEDIAAKTEIDDSTSSTTSTYSSSKIKETVAAIVDDNQSSSNTVYSSEKVVTELAKKQDTLTFDTSPTSNSTNPVTSGGLATILASIESEIASKKSIGTKLTATVKASTSGSTVTVTFSNTGGIGVYKIIKVIGYLGLAGYPRELFACDVAVATFGTTTGCKLISHTDNVNSASLVNSTTDQGKSWTGILTINCAAISYSSGAAEAYLVHYLE